MFDPYQRWVKNFGHEILRSPVGVAIDLQGNIFISDNINHKIQIFNSSGHSIRQIGDLGKENHQLCFPWGIAVDKCGHVVIGTTTSRLWLVSHNPC